MRTLSLATDSKSSPSPCHQEASDRARERGTVMERKRRRRRLRSTRDWGAWVAQSAQRPTSAQVTISQLVSSSPASGSVLTAQNLEPALDSVSPSVSLPLPHSCYVSLCVSKISKHRKKKKKSTQDLGQSPERGGDRLRQLLVTGRGSEKKQTLQAIPAAPACGRGGPRLGPLPLPHRHLPPMERGQHLWEAWSSSLCFSPGAGGRGRKQTGR